MTDATLAHFFWALILGAVSAVSLPLGSLVAPNMRFHHRHIAAFAGSGSGALIAALSVELVAPTSLALTKPGRAEVSGQAQANFFALVVGGVLGGILFVALDALVNQKGGHVCKMSATLAHLAAHRREELRQGLQGVLKVRPFDALPGEMTQSLARMLSLVSFGQKRLSRVSFGQLMDCLRDGAIPSPC